MYSFTFERHFKLVPREISLCSGMHTEFMTPTSVFLIFTCVGSGVKLGRSHGRDKKGRGCGELKSIVKGGRCWQLRM